MDNRKYVDNETLKKLIYDTYIKDEVTKSVIKALKEVIYLIDYYPHIMSLPELKKNIERMILDL